MDKVFLWAKDTDLDLAVQIGVLEGDLYKTSKVSTRALVHHIVDPCELWHRRFGYLHYTTLPGLQKMVTGMPEFSPKHEGICKGCSPGKNIMKSFPISKSRSKDILDLIHSSICGPVFTLLEWVCILCLVY